MFVNRAVELDQLNRWWTGRHPGLAMVWGRRRVGKSALIREFSKDLRSVTHVGAGRAVGAELRLLSRQAAKLGAADLRDLNARPYTDWDDAFDHLGRLAEAEPLLLVLDEFPELVDTSPELPNVLRAFLEQSAGLTQLRIIVCGSAVSFMRGLAEERRPLYGRMALTLQVHPLKPWEAALMLPDLTPEDRALVYGIVGGIPLYLSWWDQSGTVAENLAELACRPGARLLTEGDLVLATEAEVGEHPSQVLKAIAAGATRHSEIKDAIGAEPTRTLDRLVALRLVERMKPVTETERTKRKLYRVGDQFLDFYLGVLDRYRTEIDSGVGTTMVPVLIERLEQRMGAVWESVFRQHLRRLAASGALGEEIVGVGSFWTADGQNEIDAVVLAGISSRPVLVGEAKWTKDIDAARLAPGLLRKAESLPGIGSVEAARELTLAFAARHSVTDAADGALTVTVADVF